MSDIASGAGETAASESGSSEGASSFQSSQGTVVVPATPPQPASEPSAESPTAADAAERETDEREGALSVEEIQSRLRASRRAEKALNRELERYRQAEQAREDANKTELQRATERAEAAEARVAALERQNLAQQIAAEVGIPEWADKLDGNDARTMRADAQRIRDRLNPGGASPGMEGGVRGLGALPQPSSMDDLIRGGTRR